MSRVWTWREIELEPGHGASHEARTWLGFTFDLRGRTAIDAEILLSEVVRYAVDTGRFDTTGAVWITADRPPGALHIEVIFDSDRDFSPPSDDDGFDILDESSAAWGHVHSDGVLAVWFEVTIPAASWELEVVEDGDLIERMSIDPRAGAELIDRYDPLIRRFVTRYRRAGLELDDLIQVGHEALLGAADRFDRSKGTFERFASRTIAGSLKKHLRDRGWSVRPPRGLQELVLEMRRAEQDLSQRLGRVPSPAEMAEETGRSPDEVHRARSAAAAFDAGSLDEPLREHGETMGQRMGAPDPAIVRAPRWAAVDSVVDVLGEREREIVRLRYFEDLTQREIATRVGVSQMHVSRLLRDSVEAMRAAVGVSDHP